MLIINSFVQKKNKPKKRSVATRLSLMMTIDIRVSEGLPVLVSADNGTQSCRAPTRRSCEISPADISAWPSVASQGDGA